MALSKMNNDENDNKELLLSEEEKRYVIFPIKQDLVWSMYKKAIANFWTPEEIDLEKDLTDYVNLNDDEQHFINMIAFLYYDGCERKSRIDSIMKSKLLELNLLWFPNCYGDYCVLLLSLILTSRI